MERVEVVANNHVYVGIRASTSVIHELWEHFSFDVPGAKFSPKFKNKMWDGKIHLLNKLTGSLYVGLVDRVLEYCEAEGYEFEDTRKSVGDPKATREAVAAFMASLKLCSGGKAIEARDYQIDAIYEALASGRRTLISPTGSGKSLIIYGLIRWFQAHGKTTQLIVVPTVGLVTQMYKDFEDYSTFNGWDVREECGQIYAGKAKLLQKPVTISTWQSLFRLDRDVFKDLDVFYGDEAHRFAAASLKKLLEKGVNTPYKFSTTGTLSGQKTHTWVIEGLFGPSYQVTTTRDLMDTKQLASVKIDCVILEYSEAEKKAWRKTKKTSYEEEVDYLIGHPKRNRFIRNLALSRKGNTLLLFKRVEDHGEGLYKDIKAHAADERKVFYVHGNTSAEVRESVRDIVKSEQMLSWLPRWGCFQLELISRVLRTSFLFTPCAPAFHYSNRLVAVSAPQITVRNVGYVTCRTISHEVRARNDSTTIR
jgi:superfamily II DNA or RNA helicase